MKSRPLGAGQSILASQNNDKRDDARGGSFLLAHQQLGVLALGTNPSNNQVVPIVINGTTVTVTFVTSIGSTANNVLIGASATASVQNLINFLRRPDLTTSTQIAASSANQQLLQYVGWAWPGSSTNIVPFSLNKSVNGAPSPLSSFNITGITVTSGTWTAQTMQLYIEDGTYYIAGTRYLFTGGSTPTVTAPVSNPRIDVLTIDTTGTLAWTTGTENASPSAPSYPANKVPICELYNVVGETALYDNENQQSSQGYVLNDVRPSIGNPYGQFILDPGSEAQGDVLYYNGSAWARLPAGTSGFVLSTQGASANPQWVLNGGKANVSQYSTTTYSDATNGSYHDAFTFNSIPALTNGQSMLLRFYVQNGGNWGSGTSGLKLIFNGTTIWNPTISNNGGAQYYYFDCLIGVPTASSTQLCCGTASVANGSPGFSPGTIAGAANISSAWTLKIQTEGSSQGGSSTTWSLLFLELMIIN